MTPERGLDNRIKEGKMSELDQKMENLLLSQLSSCFIGLEERVCHHSTGGIDEAKSTGRSLIDYWRS